MNIIVFVSIQFAINVLPSEFYVLSKYAETPQQYKSLIFEGGDPKLHGA